LFFLGQQRTNGNRRMQFQQTYAHYVD
jgi:hypothetical protein